MASGIFAAAGREKMEKDEETSREDGSSKRPMKDDAASSFVVRVLMSGNLLRTQVFDRDVVTVGRDQKADLRLEDTGISRRHAEIRRNGDVFALVDLKSVNGTFVNGKRVESMQILKTGDKVTMGMFELQFAAERSISFGEAVDADAEVTADIEKLGASKIAVRKERSTSRLGLRKPERVKGYLRATDQPDARGELFISEIFQFGRAPECDVRLDAPDAPWKAAMIVRGFSEYRIVNLVSEPGQVLVNTRPVTDAISLADGDTVDIGGRTFTFTCQGGPYETAD